MKKGLDGKRIIYDYESVQKYLNSAVALNIVRSIKKNDSDTVFDVLTEDEMKTIISKVVEKYSGQFVIKLSNGLLNSVSIGMVDKILTNKKFEFDIEQTKIDEITVNKQQIVDSFVREINADTAIYHKVDSKMVKELQNILVSIQLLSIVDEEKYTFSDTSDYIDYDVVSKYYIIQPAIKYHHLTKAIETVKENPYFRNLDQQERKCIEDGLTNQVYGLMTKEIVFFDTKKALDINKYKVCKPTFIAPESLGRGGEYDMLIYNKEEHSYWAFEIKHSSEIVREQSKHLRNKMFTNAMNKRYGTRRGACVLYRGQPAKDDGVYYINLTDFSKTIDENKDIDIAMRKLIYEVEGT